MSKRNDSPVRKGLYALLKRDAEHAEFATRRDKKVTKEEHDIEVVLDE